MATVGGRQMPTAVVVMQTGKLAALNLSRGDTRNFLLVSYHRQQSETQFPYSLFCLCTYVCRLTRSPRSNVALFNGRTHGRTHGCTYARAFGRSSHSPCRPIQPGNQQSTSERLCEPDPALPSNPFQAPERRGRTDKQAAGSSTRRLGFVAYAESGACNRLKPAPSSLRPKAPAYVCE